MTVSNDDRPHPIPPSAYLRYKENWFFLIFDKDNDIFGAVHISCEPIFERISFACHLSVQGELFKHGSQTPFPDDFAFSESLSDGNLTVRFIKAHEQIDLELHNQDIDLDISFLNRGPLFNFDDYDSANPDKPSLKEITSVATNQQTHHQQQGMFTRGTVTVNTGKAAGQSFTLDALGYRDHSRSIRSDNLVQEHIWTGLHFPKHIFGVMTVTSSLRPEMPMYSGYVYDEENGLRPLRDITFVEEGEGPDNQPKKMQINLTDINDESFTLTADIQSRYASVPLQSEKPGPTPFIYDIVENFTPLSFKETGQSGIGLVEIGRLIQK